MKKYNYAKKVFVFSVLILLFSCGIKSSYARIDQNQKLNIALNEKCRNINNYYIASINSTPKDQRILFILKNSLEEEISNLKGDILLSISNITDSTYQVKFTKFENMLCRSNLMYYNNEIYNWNGEMLIISTDKDSNYFTKYTNEKYLSGVNYSYGYPIHTENDQYYGSTDCQVFELNGKEIIDYGIYSEFNYYPDHALKIDDIKKYINPNYIRRYVIKE